MAEHHVERRLAAVLAADVVGYSRLMAAEEEGTLPRLNAHGRESLEPTVAEHHGRVVKRTGALRRARRPAARLQHLALLCRQPNFSCFGNHPNLES
jgi:hypothetical protein